MFVIDRNGYLVWWSKSDNLLLDFNFHPEKKISTFTTTDSTGIALHIVLDSNMNPIDTTRVTQGFLGDIHDFQLLPNGHKLITGANRVAFDLSNYSFNSIKGSNSTIVKSTIVQEFDNNDSLVFHWDGIDHIHPSEFIDATYRYDSTSFDYTHVNAIEVDDDGNYLLSMRNTNSLVKIDRVNGTGNIIWRLGGKLSDFKFIGDTILFSGQHDIRKLTDGTYSLFDNSNSKEDKITRVANYKLDTLNMTAELVQEYKHPTKVYARAMGSYQHLEDNFRMINWGLVQRPDPTFTLIDKNDEILVELFLPDSLYSYRSYVQNSFLESTFPKITCTGSGGNLTLSAPAGFTSYEWSNGDTTASIIPADTGEYMVWVNYGVGHLGSKPYRINDLTSECLTTSITQLGDTKTQKIVFIYDTRGRLIKSPSKNELYILRYKSGRSELVVWNEKYNRFR